MSTPPIMHPFFFALFPVFALFAGNIASLLFAETLSSIAITLGMTVVLLVLLRSILGDSEKAGVLVSGFLLAFFSFGYAFSLVRGWQIADFVVGKHIYVALAVWSTLFLCYAYYFIRTRGSLRHVTNILNVTGALLVTFPLMKIGSYYWETRTAWQDFRGMTDLELSIPDSLSREKLPDIYYIILDRYADTSTLKDHYGFDNSEFIAYLSSKGFYVAAGSVANYPRTAPSLASSLNLEHINNLSSKLGEKFNDWSLLHTRLQDYTVWRFLKARGYHFVHFGSYWEPTRRNRHADVNINVPSFPLFFYSLYEATMFAPVGIELGICDRRLIQWRRELYHFDKLAELSNIKKPTFVFAHILLPHRPYVFDRNGAFLTRREAIKRSGKENYVNHVIFANEKIRALIEILLSGDITPSPIIILQADEGPFPRRYELDQLNFNWKQATKEELRQKMRILNAYYLPNVDKAVLYPSITPVNTFRLIFNLYFQASLDLLPDESYAFVDEKHPYAFFNVTDMVKHDGT